VKSEKRIDINQVTLDVFKTEEMLAYTLFNAVVEGLPPLEGFCKISKPKKSGQLMYFSVFYIIDTPDENSRNAAATVTSKIDWKQLNQMLPEVEDVMVILLDSSTDHLFMEHEIFMNNSECLSKQYILQTLLPALVRLTGFSGTDLLFWDTGTKPNDAPTTEIQGNCSLIDRLKAFFTF